MNITLAFFIALGIILVIAFAVMWLNFVERPDNDSGYSGSWSSRQYNEWNASWPPENEKSMNKSRRWWEW